MEYNQGKYRIEKLHQGISYRVLVLAVTAWIVGMSMAAMFLAGHVNLNQFYDVGNTYYVYEDYNRINAEGMLYDSSSNSFHITEKTACKSYELSSYTKKWKYIILKLAGLPEEGIPVTVHISDAVYGTEDAWYNLTFYNGENVIKEKDGKASLLELLFDNQDGKDIRFASVRVSQTVFSLPKKKFLLLSTGFFLLVFVLLSRIKWAERKNIFICCYCYLQQFWMKITHLLISERGRSNPFLAKLAAKGNVKMYSTLRKVIFFILFTGMVLTVMYGNYLDSFYYRFYMLVNGALLILAGIVNVKDEKERNSTRLKMRAVIPGRLQISFLLFALFCCCSDILITKKMAGNGVWLLLVMGYFIWTWQQVSDPSAVWRDILSGFEWNFILFSIASLVLAEQTIVGNFQGFTHNPNTLGEYMIAAAAVFLGRLVEECMGGRNWKRILRCVLELLTALFFVMESQCRASMLGILFCFSMFLHFFRGQKGKKQERKSLLLALCMLLLLSLPVTAIAQWCIIQAESYRAQRAEPSAMTPEEMNYGSTMGEGVLFDSAAEPVYAMENKLTAKLQAASFNEFTSGRVVIYQKYLSKMNLWGHAGDETVYNFKIGAHNMLLTIGYRYGVLALIPYLFFLLELVRASIRHLRLFRGIKGGNSLQPLLLAVTCIISMSLGNVEQPMRYVPWLLLYLVAGVLMTERSEKRVIK